MAVDNIGFGKSAQPQLDYTYQTQPGSFIEKLGLENIILTSGVQSLARLRPPKRVAGVVFMEAIIPPSFPMAGPPGGPVIRKVSESRDRDLLITQNVFVEQLLIKGVLTRNLT